MHREGFEPSTSGFVDRSSYPIELPVLMRYPLRRGDLDSPTSRLSGGCSASELTARTMSAATRPGSVPGRKRTAGFKFNLFPVL